MAKIDHADSTVSDPGLRALSLIRGGGNPCLPYWAASCRWLKERNPRCDLASTSFKTTRLEAWRYGSQGWLPLQGGTQMLAKTASIRTHIPDGASFRRAAGALKMFPLLNESAYIWSKLCQW
jgi:hypothetical protein